MKPSFQEHQKQTILDQATIIEDLYNVIDRMNRSAITALNERSQSGAKQVAKDLQEGTISPYQRKILDELLADGRKGRTIDAIKRYRALTGLGLKPSKEAVVGVCR